MKYVMRVQADAICFQQNGAAFSRFHDRDLGGLHGFHYLLGWVAVGIAFSVGNDGKP